MSAPKINLAKPKINQVIALNLAEQRLAQFIARHRHRANRDKGTTNAKIGPQSDEETDLIGIGAEIAFCKLMNLYPDFSLSPRSSQKGEDYGDAKLWTGELVDVKATPYTNGRLLAVQWKEKKVDWYALMTGSFPVFVYRGAMRAEELLRTKKVMNLGHGPTYAAEQAELREIEG